MFVNDINHIFYLSCEPVSLCNSKVNCLLYADDLLVMSNSEHGLIIRKEWKLQVNLKKTKLMIFHKSGRKLKASCNFRSKRVDMATSYTFLDSVLTPSRPFSANQNQLYNKGLCVMFSYSFKGFHRQNELLCVYSF